MTAPAESAMEPPRCPFCGSPSGPGQTGPLREGSGGNWEWRVYCLNRRGCNAIGPIKRTEADAVAAWNELAALRQERDDARMMLRASLRGYLAISATAKPAWIFADPWEEDSSKALFTLDVENDIPQLTPASRAALAGEQGGES